MHESYTIHQIELLSGIKAHTIRIWEKRFNLLSPKRTNTNIRYYTADDLKKVLNVTYLKSKGYKISKIALLSTTEINEEVLACFDREKPQKADLLLLNKALVTFDWEGFEEVYQRIVKEKGFDFFMLELVYPFFNEIGLLWQAGQIIPAQEHLFSNFIRKKLYHQTCLLPTGNKEKVLLFLRKDEYHELGILVYAYQLKKQGYRVLYLGQSVPKQDVLKTIQAVSPAFVLTAFVCYLEQELLEAYINELAILIAPKKIGLIGNFNFLSLHQSKLGYTVLDSPKKLDLLLGV